MTLESAVTAAPDDDRVVFEYTVENVGDAPEEITFRSGLSADFAVLEGDDEVWRASDGRMFTQALRTETVDAGDSQTFSETWDDPELGEYAVVATLNAGTDAEARADFTV